MGNSVADVLQVILVPDLVFLIFLAYTAKRCYDILNRSPSMIMWTYYGLVWAVTLCNVLRTIIQMGVGDNHTGVRLWNVLWIITRFVMTMLEVWNSPPSRAATQSWSIAVSSTSPG